MAVIVPLAAAAFTASAGMAAVAAGSVLSGYAMVAGAVLTGVGAITGKKDLLKIGAVLSLGGGLANAFSSSGSAAGSAASNAAADGAAAAGAAAEGAAGASLAMPAVEYGSQLAGQLAQPAGFGSTFGLEQAGSAFGGAAPTFGSAGGTAATGFAPVTADAIQQAASGLTQSDLSAWMDKAGAKVKAFGKEVGPWVKQNKELVEIGGQALNSMYGPQAEQADLNRDMYDYKRSMMDRAYANLNNPVKLYNYKGG